MKRKKKILFSKDHHQFAVQILKNWNSPKLTWDLLKEEFNQQLGTSFRKNAFDSRKSLRNEFNHQKEILRENLSSYKSPKDISDKITKLKLELEVVKKEKNDLLYLLNEMIYISFNGVDQSNQGQTKIIRKDKLINKAKQIHNELSKFNNLEVVDNER